MAVLKGTKTLFFVTSPRTPFKMLPEIKLLGDLFSGKPWNQSTQKQFIKELSETEGFKGIGSVKDPAFSARDRINRGPKMLGLVDLNPVISLTEAGKLLFDDDLKEEALLRQLLKFQLPSPYHKISTKMSGIFKVKPYLELMRLVYTLGKISFDEVQIFGLQLTDYRKFDDVVAKILDFRRKKELHKGRYKEFFTKTLFSEIREIYKDDISEGKTKTRESNDASIMKFIATKASNMRDYTDACFRYLRATGVFAIHQIGGSLSILKDKIADVEYILETVDRVPLVVTEDEYKAYLFDVNLPVLYTDSRENLEQKVLNAGLMNKSSIAFKNTNELKKAIKENVAKKKKAIINNQIKDLKKLKHYNDIMSTYDGINKKVFYDNPLMMEWNTWRAMTMLDGGNITANLKFDDEGQPMNTAAGGYADIICDYDSFSLAVEVTLQTGQRQYESEGEPVSRHLAKLKESSGKPSYCFFIAPKINEASIAHFYALHFMNISYYHGRSIVIPLELETFKKMVEQAGHAGYTPSPKQIEAFCNKSMEIAKTANDEMSWYNKMQSIASKWLAA